MAVVEFAFVVAFAFLTLGIFSMEMGRLMFYWNATAEATRLGARTAVVCDPGDVNKVKAKMSAMFGAITPGEISVVYTPNGCTVNSCKSVTVSIAPGKGVSHFIPDVVLSLVLPPFTTTLSRESLASQVNGIQNPMCQ